jgi:hypothetical protein
LETTIASYLTARRSRNLIVAGHQELTIEWWRQHRQRFEVFISDLVLQEAARGDRKAASKRLAEMAGVKVLAMNEEARQLAREFIERRLIPEKAVDDAFHVAIATAQGMDFLLTLNCRHIANAENITPLQAACKDLGYEMPTLCAPEQLMGQ